MQHKPECQWEKTKSTECEYRETHHYCPHKEHSCTCEQEQNTEVPAFDYYKFLHMLETHGYNTTKGCPIAWVNSEIESLHRYHSAKIDVIVGIQNACAAALKV